MENSYDVIIIGAGPAGMTAAVYASRAELKVLILEKGIPGGKMVLTPNIENWPGYESISGPELSEQMHAHSTAFGAAHVMAEVTEIKDLGAWKEVICDEVTYRAKAVIIASGTIEKHLGIPGEAEYYGLGLSYCAVCDGAFYRNKTVIVIGAGNSAFEDAIYLTRFAKEVKVVSRRDVSRAEKTTQKDLLANPKIEWIKSYKPVEIVGVDGVVDSVKFVHSQDESKTLELKCSGVFPMVGLDANTAFLKFPDMLDEEGFIKANLDMSTNVPGIFSAGDINVKALRQIVTATADAAIAAMSASAYIEHWKE